MKRYIKVLLAIITIMAPQIVKAQEVELDETTVQLDVLTDLVDIPWDISWGPDHMLWITDGPSIKKINPSTGVIKTIFTSPRMSEGFPIGNGLGLTFHPDFFNTPQVFVVMDSCFYYANCNTAIVYRYDYSFTDDILYNETELFRYNHAGEHSGGRLITTLDGKIMLTTADYYYWLPPESLKGRILRFNTDGTAPNDNPFNNPFNKLTWTIGHRNPQGLCQAPNGKVYASEHGQFRLDQDELNIIVAGNDYGWPAYDGFSCGIVPDSCASPTYTHTPPIDGGTNPPAGIDYYNHPSIPEFENAIIEGALNTFSNIIGYNLDLSGDKVIKKTPYFQGVSLFRVRDVCTAPSGKVYMIANDRDNLKGSRLNPPKTSDATIRVFGNVDYNYCTPTSSVLYHSICDGGSIVINNEYYESSGNVVETVINKAGCDSLIIHVIEKSDLPGYHKKEPTIEICRGDSVVIFGNYESISGIYTDIFTSINGCDSSFSQELIVGPSLFVSKDANVLTAGEANAMYQWIDCTEMTPIDGATEQSYTATTDGNYAVIVSINGCSDTSNCFTIATNGIIKNNFGNKLLVHPNPTNGEFSVDLGEHYESVKIIITDLGGKHIQSKTFSNSQLLEFNLDAVNGLYLMILESENKKAVIKLVKE